MPQIEIIVLIVLILIILLIWFFKTYNSIQILLIKLNTIEGEIDNVLRDKYDLLDKGINYIKEIDKKIEFDFDLEQLKDANISSFDLHRKLIEYESKYTAIYENNKKLKSNESLTEISTNLNDLKTIIKASIMYYDDTISIYNRYINRFPSNVVGTISRCKTKLFFSGKNMNDDDLNDFKI